MSPDRRYELPRFEGRFDHLFANRRRVLLGCLIVAVPFIVWRAVFGGPDWADLVVGVAAVVAAIRAITPDERWHRPDPDRQTSTVADDPDSGSPSRDVQG